MYKLFSQNDSYILPNGVTQTGKQLIESGQYSFILEGSTVVDLSDGILHTICTVDDLRTEYGIEASDASDVITEAEAMRMAMARSRVQKAIKQDSVSKVAQIMALSFTDEQAIEVADLYPEYEVDHAYKKDDRFQYNGSLYKVNQNHTSAAQWVPGTSGTESLYTNLMLDDSGYQIWKQPTGAHDAYNIGDIVRYPDANGQLYKSTINGNVWAPDAYPQGWEVYTEE